MPKLGEDIPLVAQLVDGWNKANLISRVTDAAGRLVWEGLLDHVEGGQYRRQGVKMPDSPYVVARYEVLNDPGEKYGISQDTFELEPDPLPEVERILLDKFDERLPLKDDYFTGLFSSQHEGVFLEGFATSDFVQGEDPPS